MSNNIFAQETTAVIWNLLNKEEPELKGTLCNVEIADTLEDIIK